SISSEDRLWWMSSMHLSRRVSRSWPMRSSIRSHRPVDAIISSRVGRSSSSRYLASATRVPTSVIQTPKIGTSAITVRRDRIGSRRQPALNCSPVTSGLIIGTSSDDRPIGWVDHRHVERRQVHRLGGQAKSLAATRHPVGRSQRCDSSRSAGYPLGDDELAALQAASHLFVEGGGAEVQHGEEDKAKGGLHPAQPDLGGTHPEVADLDQLHWRSYTSRRESVRYARPGFGQVAGAAISPPWPAGGGAALPGPVRTAPRPQRCRPLAW